MINFDLKELDIFKKFDINDVVLFTSIIIVFNSILIEIVDDFEPFKTNNIFNVLSLCIFFMIFNIILQLAKNEVKELKRMKIDQQTKKAHTLFHFHSYLRLLYFVVVVLVLNKFQAIGKSSYFINLFCVMVIYSIINFLISTVRYAFILIKK
jgi:hypothetical protein